MYKGYLKILFDSNNVLWEFLKYLCDNYNVNYC